MKSHYFYIGLFCCLTSLDVCVAASDFCAQALKRLESVAESQAAMSVVGSDSNRAFVLTVKRSDRFQNRLHFLFVPAANKQAESDVNPEIIIQSAWDDSKPHIISLNLERIYDGSFQDVNLMTVLFRQLYQKSRSEDIFELII